MMWPAEEVAMRPLAELLPYAQNPRTHSPAQIDQIARSIEAFGWTNPVLVDEGGRLIAGHGRCRAAEQLGIETVPTMVARGWTDEQRRAYVIADNQLALQGGWDDDRLGTEIAALAEAGFDLALTAFTDAEIAAMLDPPSGSRTTDADGFAEPDPESPPVTKLGDVWQLGDHRVMCGDATDGNDVAELMNGREADLVHADPPYGMGKESDGVLNDNQRGEHLDEFQMRWLRHAFDHVVEHCSAYVWGLAPDLWRLWWRGGLAELREGLRVANDIVWDKGSIAGRGGDSLGSFSVASERCLLIQRGTYGIPAVNAADYWGGCEPLRLWLREQIAKAGWTAKDVIRITGSQTASHWFVKSQWSPPTREHYDTLHALANGHAFAPTFDEYEARFSDVFEGRRQHLREHTERAQASRAYFDPSGGDIDVWQFPRVRGDERYGHATPKPVDMLARALRAACPEGGLVLEPFLGSGSTLIAAEAHARTCYGMELSPRYVDAAVKRWQVWSGGTAIHVQSGDPFDVREALR